jgi:hypothetical protein
MLSHRLINPPQSPFFKGGGKSPSCKIGASYYSPLLKRGARGDFDVLFDIAIFLPDNTARNRH